MKTNLFRFIKSALFVSLICYSVSFLAACGGGPNSSNASINSSADIIKFQPYVGMFIDVPAAYEENETSMHNKSYVSGGSVVVVSRSVLDPNYPSISEFAAAAFLDMKENVTDVQLKFLGTTVSLIDGKDAAANEFSMEAEGQVAYYYVGYISDGQDLYSFSCSSSEDGYVKNRDVFVSVFESVRFHLGSQ